MRSAAFNKRLKKGHDFENKVMALMNENNTPWCCYGYEHLKQSSNFIKYIIEDDSEEANEIRSKPDFIARHQDRLVYIECKVSQTISKRSWDYLKSIENENVFICFPYNEDIYITNINDIYLNYMPSFCKVSHMSIPTDNLNRFRMYSKLSKEKLNHVKQCYIKANRSASLNDFGLMDLYHAKKLKLDIWLK